MSAEGNHSTDKSRRKVFLSYGFAEGPHHSTVFIRALRRAGFETTKHPEQADVIIAHSGGAYLMKPDQAHTKLLLIGPTFWEGKGLLKSFMENIKHGYTLFATKRSRAAWLEKMAWHAVYTIKPVALSKMWWGWLHKHTWWRQLAETPNGAIVIRNQHDAFCGPDICESIDGNIAWLSLPGFHDDLWLNPEPYLELLR